MQVFSRLELASSLPPHGEPALLLEGDWPDGPADDRWSLDSAIDSRHEWIDREAARIAEALAGGTTQLEPSPSHDLRLFAYLNARDLRYYLVKLLRVVAFFDPCWRGWPLGRICLDVGRGRDQDYAALFERMVEVRGIRLEVNWHDVPVAPPVRFPPNRPWRQVAGRLAQRFEESLLAEGSGQRRVILCGNRRFLDPVCDELLRRGARVWWLYDRFAAGAWLHWRGRGVGQLVCDSSQGRLDRFAAIEEQLPEGFDETLAPAVLDWFHRSSQMYGVRQTRMIEQIVAQFNCVRPTLLITDEDATPLPRAAIAAARLHGAVSVVVQHGAPCVRFGFAPLAADRICVWGDSSRQQLLRWGVEESRIVVTGPVGLGMGHRDEVSAGKRETSAHVLRKSVCDPIHLAWMVNKIDRPGQARRGREPCRTASANSHDLPRNVLLLATTPARDERPDAVGFHLTQRTHTEMLRVAFACVSRIPGARLTIKLHPRTRDESLFTHLLRQFPTLRAKVIRGGRLDVLIRRADCVLSCASSSGVEAAACGVPVIQLLPLGSGDILPADEWGFRGSARTEAELDELLKSSRHTPCAVATRATQCVFHDPRGAARRIVDVATGTDMTPKGGTAWVQAVAHDAEAAA